MTANTTLPVSFWATLDGQGNVFLSDELQHRVRKYAPTGELLLTIGGPHEMRYPMGLTVAAERLWVCDSWNMRVLVYGLDGTPQGAFGPFGDKEQELGIPTAIGMEADGGFWILENQNQRISQYPSLPNAAEDPPARITIGQDCLHHPVDAARVGAGFAVLNCSQVAYLLHEEIRASHHLHHPAETRIVHVNQEGVLLFDGADNTLLYFMHSINALETVTKLAETVRGVLHKGDHLLLLDEHGFTEIRAAEVGLTPELVPVRSAAVSPESQMKALLSRFDEQFSRFKPHHLLGTIPRDTCRSQDHFPLDKPLPYHLFTLEGVLYQEELETTLACLVRLLEDAGNEHIMALGADWLLTGEVARLALVARIQALAAQDSGTVDLSELLVLDLSTFLLQRSGHVLITAGRKLAGELQNEVWTALLQAEQETALLTCLAARDGFAETTPFLRDLPATACQALDRAAPYLEQLLIGSELIKQNPPPSALEQQSLSASHIANRHMAELALCYRGSDGQIYRVHLFRDIVVLARAFYHADLTDRFNHFLSSLETGPLAPLPYTQLAKVQLFMLSCQPKKGKHVIQALKDNKPLWAIANSRLLALSDLPQALSSLDIFPIEEGFHVYRGEACFIAGAYTQALEEYRAEVALGERSSLNRMPDPRRLLATMIPLCLCNLWRFDEAISFIREQQQDLPDHWCQLYLAVNERFAGQFEASRNRLLALGHTEMAAYHLGITYRWQGENESALACFEREQQNFPNWHNRLQMAITHTSSDGDAPAAGTLTLSDFTSLRWGREKVKSSDPRFPQLFHAYVQAEKAWLTKRERPELSAQLAELFVCLNSTISLGWPMPHGNYW